jgi:hypothetical protein
MQLSILYDFYGFEYGLRRSGNDDDNLIAIHKNRLQKIGSSHQKYIKSSSFSSAYLKGQSHEIFDPRFFSPIKSP